MARTASQILAELLDIAPEFLETDALGAGLLEALATVYAGLEVRVGQLLAQSFRQTATGQYLQDLGLEFGAGPKWLGETDDQYRDRVVIGPKGVTPNFIRDYLHRLSLLEGYFIDTVEPRQSVLDDGFFLGTVGAVLVSKDEPHPKQLFWLHVPIFELRRLREVDQTFLGDDTAGVGVGAFLDTAAFLDGKIEDTSRRVYKRLWGVLDAYRAAGVAYGATIADIAQEAHFGLFEDLDL